MYHAQRPRVTAGQLAQHLVCGAVACARTLVLEPHADFDESRDHLSGWQGASPVRFGHDGKPLFIQGPNDDVRHIRRTLDRTVGRGNFHFMLAG
jgi:hypothetical protein